MSDRDLAPVRCFVCDLGFTALPKDDPANPRALTQVWADGERIIMICAACALPPDDPSSCLHDFDEPDIGVDDLFA